MVKGLRVRSKTHNLPPGPWKLPLIGSLHHLIGYLPHHRMRQLAQIYGPIMHLQRGEISTIVVSSPEVAKDILKTYDSNFAQRPHQIGADIVCYGSTDISTAPYGGYWKQLRICSQELLCTKRVRSFESLREEEVSNLIKYISTNIGSSINLSEKVSCMTSSITSRAAFGKICKDQQEVSLLSKKLVTRAESFLILDLFPSQKWIHLISRMKPKLVEIHRKFDIIIENLIKETIITKTYDETEPEGLLSVLLNINDHEAREYPLTNDNIKAVILDMFSAGTDTTTAIIEWSMSEMLKNPRVLTIAQEVREFFGRKGYCNSGETALQELKYLKAVIKETMRLHPAFPFLLPRECIETCEIQGYTIPSGTKVIISGWAMGRDQKYWSEPDMFSPERFLDCPMDYKGSNIEYIPFGAGRRMCTGMLFGLSSIELSLSQLLYHYNWNFLLEPTRKTLI